jgi:hypothetical protein
MSFATVSEKLWGVLCCRGVDRPCQEASVFRSRNLPSPLWLAREVADADVNPVPAKGYGLFSPEVAMPRFGVGKNMVDSMRFWALAGVLESEGADGFQLGKLGAFLFGGSKAVDPLLEATASLWLLHWQLVSTPDHTTTWFWAFNHFDPTSFDRNTLSSGLMQLVQEAGIRRGSPATLKRDVDCFLHTYVMARNQQGLISEESLACPLAELNLIARNADSESYSFQRGLKNILHDAIFNYALYDYWRREVEASTLCVERIGFEPGSPGRAFKLDEHSVVDRLSRIDDSSSGVFRWIDSSGVRQVAPVKDNVDPVRLLSPAYRSQLRL